MTTYPHELTECENCGAHYCMGCAGEKCPNCKLQEVAFYAIELEHKLEVVRKYLDTIIIPSVSDITYFKSLLGSKEEK